MTPVDRKHLVENQTAKFRKLLQTIRHTSEFYRNIIDNSDIDLATCSLLDFPILTKSAYMTHFDEICTESSITKERISEFLESSRDPSELYLQRYRVIHTSGSSGEVGYFVFSPDDWQRAMSAGQELLAHQPRRERPAPVPLRIAFYGAIDGHYAGVSMCLGQSNPPYTLDLLDVNRPLADIIEHLNIVRPDVLIGYPSALKVLAGCQNHGKLRISPLSIIASGETISSNDRAFLRATFSCGIRINYGCSEHLLMGTSPPHLQETIIFDDQLIFEFRSDCTLVTNLFNYTLPLIRYAMSDVLTPCDAVPSIAPYTAVSSVIGRTEIQPYFINEAGELDFISPITISEIYIAGLTHFQLRILSDSFFEFVAVLDPSMNIRKRKSSYSGLCRRLREILASKRMNNVQFEVKLEKLIPVNKRTGKVPLVIDTRSS